MQLFLHLVTIIFFSIYTERKETKAGFHKIWCHMSSWHLETVHHLLYVLTAVLFEFWFNSWTYRVNGYLMTSCFTVMRSTTTDGDDDGQQEKESSQSPQNPFHNGYLWFYVTTVYIVSWPATASVTPDLFRKRFKWILLIYLTPMSGTHRCYPWNQSKNDT